MVWKLLFIISGILNIVMAWKIRQLTRDSKGTKSTKREYPNVYTIQKMKEIMSLEESMYNLIYQDLLVLSIYLITVENGHKFYLYKSGNGGAFSPLESLSFDTFYNACTYSKVVDKDELEGYYKKFWDGGYIALWLAHNKYYLPEYSWTPKNVILGWNFNDDRYEFVRRIKELIKIHKVDLELKQM